MQKEHANELLNKVRDGQKFSFEQISAALFATGDLHDPMRGERMEDTLQSQSPGTWESSSSGLVGLGEKRHTENSWPGWSRYLD
jgi:hypothetical protein